MQGVHTQKHKHTFTKYLQILLWWKLSVFVEFLRTQSLCLWLNYYYLFSCWFGLDKTVQGFMVISINCTILKQKHLNPNIDKVTQALIHFFTEAGWGVGILCHVCTHTVLHTFVYYGIHYHLVFVINGESICLSFWLTKK